MTRFLLTTTAATLLSAGFLAAPAMAVDAKLYPYRTTENYCPNGLQPVVFGGEISCGTPNQKVSYAYMKQHPATRRAGQGGAASAGGHWDGSKSPRD